MRWLMMGYSPEDERVQSLEGVGQTVDTGDNETWQAAARTQYDGIWVRWTDVDHAIRPVVQYRSMQPTTRIIIEIPPDLSPPNADIAQWVAWGIYDIVRPSTDTETMLRTPGTIADVLSWTGFQPVDHGNQAGDGQSAKPKIEFRTIEKVVEKRVAASSRPVLIAVVGVSPGVGTTTTAIRVAKTLSGSGHDVALIESPNAPPALSRWEEELPPITVFANPGPDPVELVRKREWPYVVVDGGSIGEWSEITPWQADLTILVGPGDRHRFSRWEPLVMSIATKYTGSIVAGAVCGGKDGARVVEGLDNNGGLTAFSVAVEAEGKKAERRAWLEMLAPVLPDSKGRRRWWRKAYVPAVADLPAAINATSSRSSNGADSDWKYTTSPSAVPYAPAPAPTGLSLNVQIGRGSRSPLSRAWHWAVNLAILWGIASIISWFLVLASSSGSEIPINVGRWLIWAQWITATNGHLLSLL